MRSIDILRVFLAAAGVPPRALYATRLRVHSLVAHFHARSAWYRDLLSRHGITASDLADIALSDLPIVDRRELQREFDLAVTRPDLSTPASIRGNLSASI